MIGILALSPYRFPNLESSVRRPSLFATTSGLAGAVAVAALSVSPAAAAGPQTGSAFAVSVQATVLNAVGVDVPALPKATYPAGQDKSVVKIDLPTNLPGHAKLLNASSEVKGGVLTSAASIADVDLLGLVKAKIVTATCVSDGKTVTGESHLADVWVAGKRIDVAVTGKIAVSDLVTVWVNEKVRTGDTLTVNALRVSVGGAIANVSKADVILAQARCAGPSAKAPGGGSGTTPATPTTVPDGGVTTPGSPSSSVRPPATTTSAATTTSTGVPVGSSDGGDLAETGVSAVLPLSLAGGALMSAGAFALWWVRRARSA
ncbi:putative secreted protein [Alloactinosynnema sp. L-07]|uniref:choice-of-anchor P family protein n=1 Tax=Alloactinosynnema sp. L-07 TaxID=1653480 RepID=UPI00065EF28E|nr:choice-of-anchor P family protein [Alloactinosynnema sp. L-07]CRK61449.1 putative secreted protein [Alloactinosynnema sp. L-07]